MLPFWKVAKTRTKSTNIQKIANVTKVFWENKKAEAPTFRQCTSSQKQFWGAFWAIHMLEVPQISFVRAAWCLSEIKFLEKERKEIFLPFSTDYIYVQMAARPATAQCNAHLSWRCCFLILAKKETCFANERALYQADRTSLWKFKVSMLNHYSKKKTSQTKMLYFLNGRKNYFLPHPSFMKMAKLRAVFSACCSASFFNSLSFM